MTVFTKEHKIIGEKVNGDPLSVPIFRLIGDKPGKKVYIQANMHGAEVQGNAVIYQLMEQLNNVDIQGEIVLVPFSNPIGCNGKSGEYTLGRYDPVTGNNWNRHYFYDGKWIEAFAKDMLEQPEEVVKRQFRTKLIENLTAKLNADYGIPTTTLIDLQVQKLALEADIVLDLHTGPISAAHLYCPEYAKSSASYFNIPHVLLIPNEFDGALDESCFCPWWTLQQAFAKLGRHDDVWVEAFTVELGSQEQISFTQAESDASSIISYLSSQQVFAEPLAQPEKITRYACYLENYKVLYAKQGGLVEFLTEPGTVLKQGELLARQMCLHKYPDTEALVDIQAPEDLIAILHYPSASVYPGAGLYKVFTRYFTL